jgi:hypothetical protein
MREPISAVPMGPLEMPIVNQSAASMLILSASVLATAALLRSEHPAAAVAVLAAVGLSIWGITALATACVRSSLDLGEEPGEELDDEPFVPAAHRLEQRRGASRSWAETSREKFDRAPDVEAQLSLVAHLKGANRQQVLDDLLRRHLPRVGKARAA